MPRYDLTYLKIKRAGATTSRRLRADHRMGFHREQTLAVVNNGSPANVARRPHYRETVPVSHRVATARVVPPLTQPVASLQCIEQQAGITKDAALFASNKTFCPGGRR
uniref:Uncharacterized protein n=1 Tax=Hyaloperonospora arabidopsidis (strain Emoy2) TaxID=559515 RepID=M4BYE1_HYAAE